MQQIIKIFVFSLLVFSCKTERKKAVKTEPIQTNNFAIAIHAGAGWQTRESISKETDSLVRLKMEEALKKGYSLLKEGKSSLDAIEETIKILENSPLFNAGKGAVFTNDETNELDSSIMFGKDLNAGAVAGVKTVKNPISAARKVMENSAHVLLSGKGADEFAKSENLEIVENEYFNTKGNLDRVKRIKEEELRKTAFRNFVFPDEKFGTVGCVALDKNGNLSAGTSTGGMTNKKWNRIGDSPIIGAGTYANNKTCAISSTGHGEFFIRNVVAYDISALIEYKELSLTDASSEVIQNKLEKGKGGIIGIDKFGNIHFEFNTPGMYRASMNEQGEIKTAIYNDEKI